MKFLSGGESESDIWLYELAHIPEELRVEEPALRTTRWFDYRDKLPLLLTQTFTDTYLRLYREEYARTRDEEYSVNVTGGLSTNDLIPLWHARQAADRLGMPYETYLRAVMKRAYEREWKYIVRPNQIYGEETFLDIRDIWDGLKRDILFLAQSPFYRTENYDGHPDQDAYHEYLISVVKLRAEPLMILTRLIHREKHLPEERASEAFGPELIADVKRYFLS
ncbi:hypothetical protein [Methylobacillus sp.]|uniref:hypothetical protein n=1 Tax=Methylobacillus sp. TaxID=56818 RepID=UPI0012C57514|nr:hypothetical protein [Methylobacillus sp.]MPS48566.1 hypothetical protein [Methylobacillus sp.]